jgi:hypothetical protein
MLRLYSTIYKAAGGTNDVFAAVDNNLIERPGIENVAAYSQSRSFRQSGWLTQFRLALCDNGLSDTYMHACDGGRGAQFLQVLDMS